MSSGIQVRNVSKGEFLKEGVFQNLSKEDSEERKVPRNHLNIKRRNLGHKWFDPYHNAQTKSI